MTRVRVGSCVMETRPEANEVLDLVERGQTKAVLQHIEDRVGHKPNREEVSNFLSDLLHNVEAGWNARNRKQPERWLKHPASRNRFGVLV